MKQIIRIILIASALVLSAHGGNVSFTLDPADGLLTGHAGTSVGWGYTISVDSNYVTIESIFFGDLTPIGIFSTPGIPGSVASSGLPIIIPWLQDISGLQYSIDPSAVLGASTQGVMTLVYDTYTDPDLTNQIGFGDLVNAQFNGGDVTAEVLVNAAAPAAVPEPGSVALLGTIIICLLLKKRLSRAMLDSRNRNGTVACAD